jgi:hypothetical protein
MSSPRIHARFPLFIAELPRLAAFTTAVSRLSPTQTSLPNLLERAMAGYDDGAANNGFGRRSLH